MTQATESLEAPRASHTRVVGAVSAAHFVSHYYILLLAPLMPFVRAEYNVSYTEIGFALAAFNIVSAVLQTPTGFLVDWLGARALLIGGLLLGGGAFLLAGVIDSFWFLVAMFAVAGIANTVYHPADYALLSQHVPARGIGQAFSMHTFAGMLGSAVAPVSLLLMESMWGWRGAFIGAACLGFAAAALIATFGSNGAPQPLAAQSHAQIKPDRGTWQLLLSTPILLNLFFFVLLALTSGGLSNYSVVALGALYGTPLPTANAALTGNLMLTAMGVLVGGFVVSRITRHGTVTAIGLLVTAVTIVVIGEFNLGAVALIAMMSLAGFFSGVIMPPRDMIVREVTPPGSFGKVFGFVTTGFNIGGIASPLIFGPIMDHGSPRLVFITIAVFTVAAIVTVITLPRRLPAAKQQ